MGWAKDWVILPSLAVRCTKVLVRTARMYSSSLHVSEFIFIRCSMYILTCPFLTLFINNIRAWTRVPSDAVGHVYLRIQA